MVTKVLLVSENQTVRKELQSLLHKNPDFELHTEADIPAAMKLLQRKAVNVIVLDAQLPALNGIMTAGAMKSYAAEQPVILLSLHTDARYVKASFSKGIAGYLLREYAYEELPEAIRAVAGGHCYLSPQIMEEMPEGFLEASCRLNMG